MPDQNPAAAVLFAFFNEVGIVNQLATALFSARLPQGFLMAHFTVLNHLVRVGDGRTPLALARAFQTPKTSMTHTLAGLERHGLIRFAPNPRDGRSKCVWITEAGRRFRTDAIAGFTPEMAALAARFDLERLAPLIPPLADLRRVLDAMRDPDQTSAGPS